jgi:tripartite ATP-independent transporter DctP family solute receptor
MVLIGTGGISEFSPKMGIGECPFIWRDVEHMAKVLDSEAGKELTDELLRRRGLRVLSFFYYGSRNLTANKPIRTPAEMRGFKLRTPTVPVLVAMARSWGAEPTPMDLSELYLSLQTNVVDGQENPVPTIAANKFNEVQKYLILTQHVKTPAVLLISERRFQELGEANQKIILDAAKEAKALNDRLTIEAESPEAIRKLGMEVIEPDMAAFRQTSSVVPPQFEEVWGKGLYDKIVNTR